MLSPSFSLYVFFVVVLDWASKPIISMSCFFLRRWWFDFDRKEADKMLLLPGNTTGTFLVRESQGMSMDDIWSPRVCPWMVFEDKVCPWMVFKVSRYAHGWYLESQGMSVDVFEVTRYRHGWYLKKGLEPQTGRRQSTCDVMCVCLVWEKGWWEITSRHVLRPDLYS